MKKLIYNHTELMAAIFTTGMTALAMVSAIIFFFFNGDMSACLTAFGFSGFIIGFVVYIIQPAVYIRLVAKKKRELLQEEVKLTQELSELKPLIDYRWAPPNLYDLENRLAEVRAQLAKLEDVDVRPVSFPHNHLAVLGLDKTKRYVPPTTRVVSVNWKGLKRFLGWKGTTEDLKRLKLK